MKSNVDKIKRLRTVILNIFALTAICLAAVTPLIISKIHSENQTTTQLKELLNLSGDIIYLDEVLTMSARMYAFTSDQRWQLRYDEHVPILDEKMAAAISINEEIAENLKQTDFANQQLISIETNAFSLVSKGEANRAVEALTDATYVYYKQLYSVGVSDSLQLAVSNLENRQTLLSKEVSLYTWLYAVAAVVFFLLLGFFIRYSRKAEELNREYKAVLERELTISKEAEKALLQANYAKNRFLANISHEIKTPLNGILGNLQLLASETLSIRGTKIMQLLEKSSNKLNTKLKSILDIVEIESSELSLQHERFDLDSVYVDCVSMALEQCKNKKLSFERECNVTQSIRIGDAIRLSQLINNLLDNAIKFTHKGGISFNISQGDNTNIKITVSDTGIGMSDITLENAYSAFSQGDISSTKSFEGLGTGLSITKALVELMQGSITFESNKDGGTKVDVTLPFAYASDDVCKSIRAETEYREANTLKILMAEDEYINQEIVKDMLQSLNATIEIAQNGEEAVFKVDNNTSLILMDIQMPEMDGITACKLIKKKYPHIPIIAVTANVSGHDIKKYDSVGIDSVVAKPVNKSLLLDTIATYVNVSQHSKSSQETTHTR